MMDLKITEGKFARICIQEKEYEIMDLNRNQLMEIFEHLYENPTSLDFTVANETVTNLLNPVEREVSKQILNKLREFADNSNNIKNEFNDKFPEI